jgi:peptidoglycan/LPS O-acetylase OafA/YrhL
MAYQLPRRPVLGASLALVGIAVGAYAVIVWKYMEHSSSFVPDVVIVVAALVMMVGINFMAAPRRPKGE